MYNSDQKRPLAVPPVLATKRLNLDAHQNGLQLHRPAIGPPIHPYQPIGAAATAAAMVVMRIGWVVHGLYPQPPLSPLDGPVVAAAAAATALGPAAVLGATRPFQSLPLGLR